MPRKEKTVKVQLTKKVHSFRLGDVSYKPGAVFEVPERNFRPDFMEKVVPPAKAIEVISEKFEGEAEETPEVPTEALGEVIEAPDEEKKGTKKR